MMARLLEGEAVTGLRVLLSRLLGRGRTAADLDGEVAAHIELLAADLERARDVARDRAH